MKFLDSDAVIDYEAIALLVRLDNLSLTLNVADSERIKEISWITDGIVDTEQFTLRRLVECSEHSPDVFSALLHKPWFSDNLTVNEEDVAVGLCHYASYGGSHALNVLGFEFLNPADGFDDAELAAFRGLIWCGRQNPDALNLLLQNPSARDGLTVDEANILSALCSSFLYADLNDVKRLLSHSALSNGISEEDARMLNLLSIVQEWRPGELASILSKTSASLLSNINDAGLTIEERTIELPATGETTLTILRYRQAETPTMDFLERALRFNEAYMGEPFPTDWIVLYFDNEDNGLGTAHHFTHIAMREELEMTSPGGWGADLPYVLVHETGHYYWHSSQRWIEEGAANFLVYLTKRAWIGQEAATEYAHYRYPACRELAGIAQLEALDTVPEDDAFACNYEFGVRLFVELYHTLGETTFGPAFRNLYLKRLHDDPTDDCKGVILNICHLAAAFKADASKDVAAKVDEIIARHYGPIP